MSGIIRLHEKDNGTMRPRLLQTRLLHDDTDVIPVQGLVHFIGVDDITSATAGVVTTLDVARLHIRLE